MALIPSLEQTAWEEAAHATAGLALPMLPIRVWIDPSAPQFGPFRLGGGYEPQVEVFVPWSWHLAVAVAGPAGAVLHRQGRPGDLDMEGTDLQTAQPALAGAPWISKEAAVARIFRWLSRPDVWLVVECIARELLARFEANGRRGEIPGEELFGVAFSGWERTPTWGLVREWGQPLRRAFPPAAPALRDWRRLSFGGW